MGTNSIQVINTVTVISASPSVNIGTTPVQVLTSSAQARIVQTGAGVTTQQSADIIANNAKTGITTQQSADILTNNAKTGITTQQSADILTNNAKTGITTQQSADIINSVRTAGGVMTGDLAGTDFINTRSGAITRTANFISKIVKTGGRTLTVARDVNNRISSINDGARTYTMVRSANKITSWTVA